MLERHELLPDYQNSLSSCKLSHFNYSPIIQFLKFCIVGILGSIIDTAILIVLVEFAGLDPRAAAVLTFFVAVSFTYLLNRFWTFNASRTYQAFASYTRFVTVCLGGLLIRIVIMHFLIELFNMGIGYRYVLASVCGIFAATLFNFLGSTYIVFSTNKDKKIFKL